MVCIHTDMGSLVDIEDRMPHKVSEVICIRCGHRWIAVRPEGTLLKTLECQRCDSTGFAIETGEDIVD